MKKYIYFAMILAGGLLASCDDTNLGGPKDEIGMTATEALAGEWYVHADAIKNGEVISEDPDGIGTFEILTYNTAANDPTKMIVDDEKNYWSFKGVVNCNIEDLTFSANDSIANEYYAMNYKLTNGKILLKAAHSPRGYEVDSICFDIAFGDDARVKLGLCDGFRISGYRRTGFNQGEE